MCPESLAVVRVLLFREESMKTTLPQLLVGVAVVFVVGLVMIIVVSFPAWKKSLSTAPDNVTTVLFRHSLFGDGALYLVLSGEERFIASYSPSEYGERIESIVWHTNELTVIISGQREARGPKEFRIPLTPPSGALRRLEANK